MGMYGGRCGYVWGGGMHRFSILRIILALLIACAVFSVGVKVGEFRSRFGEGFFDYPMMQGGFGGGRYMMNPGYFYGPNMMYPQGTSGVQVPTQTK